MAKLSTADRPLHMLELRDIEPMRNFRIWVQRWWAAEYYEELISLLHVGLALPNSVYTCNEPELAYLDRVRFYLNVADGWNDSMTFWSEHVYGNGYLVGYRDGSPVYATCDQMRKKLAEKAFHTLCAHFFKQPYEKGRHEETRNYWKSVILKPNVLRLMMLFFCLEPYGDDVRMRNLPHRSCLPWQKVAIDYCSDLALEVVFWTAVDAPSFESAREKKERLASNEIHRSMRPSAAIWAIEVLAQLGQLERLIDPDNLRRMELVDQVCLKRLEEIAMRTKLYDVRPTRKVASLAEAQYEGSDAAWVLARIQNRQAQSKRLWRIRNAEITRDRAQAEIRELRK